MRVCAMPRECRLVGALFNYLPTRAFVQWHFPVVRTRPSPVSPVHFTQLACVCFIPDDGGWPACRGRGQSHSFELWVSSNILKNPTRRTFDLGYQPIDLELPQGQPTRATGRLSQPLAAIITRDWLVFDPRRAS